MIYFHAKNPNLGALMRALEWNTLGDYIYGHSQHLTAIWYILLPYGIFWDRLVHFPPFWYVVPRKIWQPCSKCRWQRQFRHLVLGRICWRYVVAVGSTYMRRDVVTVYLQGELQVNFFPEIVNIHDSKI
jgi:hypothetical protein